MNKLMNTKEIRDYLRISDSTICRWREQGLPHVKIGYKSIRYNKDSVDLWISERFDGKESAE